MDLYDLPDPNDMPEDSINEYYGKFGGMDVNKGDKDNDVTPEEMDNIERFLRDFDDKNYPPNGPEDYLF